MGMRQTLEVLNAMVRDGVVARYAIGGAVAAYQYVEATVTEDLDILVSFEATAQRRSGLIVLTPILDYLAARGYTEFRQEGVLVEGWPVQFLPVSDDLDAEALACAEEIAITIPPDDTSITTRILTSAYIVATALRVGRPKDRSRILQFVEERAVDYAALCPVLVRHDLADRWRAFCAIVGIENPCGEGVQSP